MGKLKEIYPDIIVVEYRLDYFLGSEICLEIKRNPSTKHFLQVLFSASNRIQEIADASCVDALFKSHLILII